MKANLYEFKLRKIRRSMARDVGPTLGERVIDPKSVAAVVRPFILGEARECFLTLSLDSRNVLIGVEVTAIGTISHVEVHPRECFRSAILSAAAAIVIVHNHPSGDPKPSDSDYELTVRFMKAGELLGIPVMDHVVVTDTGHYSIREDIERAGEPEIIQILIGGPLG